MVSNKHISSAVHALTTEKTGGRCRVKRAFLQVIPALALAAFLSPALQASEYGCTVLLCLSNPNGPKAVSVCVPPIEQLFSDLALGLPFPSCNLASAPDSKLGPLQAQEGVLFDGQKSSNVIDVLKESAPSDRVRQSKD